MLALFIFLFTLFCIIKRPFGLGIWIYSSLGAVLTAFSGLIQWKDLFFILDLIWDSTFSLIGLIIISRCLQSLGFFEWIIYAMLKFCCSPLFYNKNNTHLIEIHSYKMLFSLLFFGTCISAVLANDGAILVLTPLVLGIVLRAKNMPSQTMFLFLFSVGFIADVTSNPLVISNLTNIITARFYQLDFFYFSQMMFLPNFFSFISTFILFYALFKNKLSNSITFHSFSHPKLSNILFFFHLAVLIVFIGSFFISTHFDFPLSLNCLIYALFLLIILWNKSPIKAIQTLKKAPFTIIVFLLGLFIIVFGLQKINLESFQYFIFQYLIEIYLHNKIFGIFCITLFSAIASSFINNLPMVFWGNLVLMQFLNTDLFVNSSNQNLREVFIYAHLLGCNIGSKLMPFGSLCTILWFSLLSQKGIVFSWKSYLKYSLILTFPILFFASFGLYLSLFYFSK